MGSPLSIGERLVVRATLPKASLGKVLCVLVERRVEPGQLRREADGRHGQIVAVRPVWREISWDKGFRNRNMKVCKDHLAVDGHAFHKADVMELHQMRLCPL